MNDSLQIHRLRAASLVCQNSNSLAQVLRQLNTRQRTQSRRGKKPKPGLALQPPQLAVDIDNPMAKKVPRALLEEVALLKDALVAEDKVEVARVADDDAWWK